LGSVDGLGAGDERPIATIRLRFRDRPTRDALQARTFPNFGQFEGESGYGKPPMVWLLGQIPGSKRILSFDGEAFEGEDG